MPVLAKVGRRPKRYFFHAGTILAVGCLFILLVLWMQPFTSVNWRLSDQLFVPEPLSPNIVIVGIDDATLATYGKWSDWQRSLHAQAIDNLSKAGARVIALDIIFADTSDDDLVLAQAIKKAGNVVLPVVGVEPLPPGQSHIVHYDRLLMPVLPLEQACLSLGHANVVPDGDSVVRRLPLVIKDSSGQSYPAFALAVLHALFSKPLPQDYPAQNGKVHLLDRDIPVDACYNLRINFASMDSDYTILSYGDIITGDFVPSAVKHKIVLVGMTATGESDVWATPISVDRLPGVWVHASAMDTILRQRFLIDADWSITLLTLLVLLGITGSILPRLKLRWGGLLVVGLAAGYLLAAFLAFDNGYILNILYPEVLLALTYATSVLCVVVSEQSDKQFVKELFGRYVSPQVAAEIIGLADAGKLELGGEQRTVSILFADIRGFTEMCDQMPVSEVVDILNDNLSIIIRRVLDNEGMVNKFAGDNVMAVWNAPQFQKEHARLAVKAALEAQQSITERQRDNPSLPKVQFGIGINTGEAIAGNMGSAGRAEYTVIGDAVNLASRICSAAPGGEIWIGPETYRQVADYIEAEELEPQSFKGKAGAVTVYRVLRLK